MNEYKLKNNSMLTDGCFLDSWYSQLQKLSRDSFNPLNMHLPKQVFKRNEDKELLDQIKKKTTEIIDCYKKLRKRFFESLNNEVKKHLY